MSIQTSIEVFTPQSAEAALKLNKSNRPLSKSTVNIYAAALKRNEWTLNGEAIIFDSDGNLTNGQHRLYAVISSKVPLTTVVVRGVRPDSFKTVDSGKKRNAPDVLAIAGFKNATLVQSACRAIIRIEEGAYGKAIATTTHILKCIENHPTVPFWSTRFSGSNVKNFMTSSLVGVLVLSAERYGSDQADEFLTLVSTGLNMSANHPAYLLREKFINRSRGQVFSPDYGLAICVKAVNAYITKAPIKILRINADEQFPELV